MPLTKKKKKKKRSTDANWCKFNLSFIEFIKSIAHFPLDFYLIFSVSPPSFYLFFIFGFADT